MVSSSDGINPLNLFAPGILFTEWSMVEGTLCILENYMCTVLYAPVGPRLLIMVRSPGPADEETNNSHTDERHADRW